MIRIRYDTIVNGCDRMAKIGFLYFLEKLKIIVWRYFKMKKFEIQKFVKLPISIVQVLRKMQKISLRNFFLIIVVIKISQKLNMRIVTYATTLYEILFCLV